MISLLILSVFVKANADSNSLCYSLSFDIGDFNIEKDSVGKVSITSDKIVIGYSDNTSLPALPSKGIAVALPADSRFGSCSFVATSKVLIHSNVYVLPNPKAVVIGETIPADSIVMPDYGSALYPDVALSHSYDIYTDKTTIVNFSFCPFEYDAATGNLSFIQSGELTVTYTDGLDCNFLKTRFDEADERYFAETVIDYPSEDGMVATVSADNNIAIAPISDPEYLIVTNNELKNSFQKLADWKTVKGVPTEVVTVEEIEGTLSGADLPLSIKAYLRGRYIKSKKLQYVLLGGDDTVIPVRYCYGAATNDTTNILVTDLYYGCLSGEFEWDSNNNGIYGEPADSIDLSIQLNVSRLPVRTPVDVNSYVNKLVKYEGPRKHLGNQPIDRFLICGVKAFANPMLSNVYAMYNNLSSLVDSLWNGNIVRFMDNNTDFEGGADYDLSANNLHERLSSGYRFMTMFSHGRQTCWEIENGEMYTSNLASSLNSNFNSLITTIACHTNAFDCATYGEMALDSDPCLSEAFIRNPFNCVIAYLGASREGLASNRGLGASFSYDREFYSTLFSNVCPYNNFSRVVAATKRKMANVLFNPRGNIKTDNYWVHFCLNPVGDAEVPIYTNFPLEQNEPTFSMISNDVLSVTVDNEECRIAISGASDSGKSFYGVSNRGSASFSGFDKRSMYVSISRPGYRPLLYYGKLIDKDVPHYTFIKCDRYPYEGVKAVPAGEIQSCTLNGNQVYVTTRIEGRHDNIEIRISLSDGTYIDSSSVACENEVETNSLSVQSGVNVVTLVAEGEVLDSRIVVK